MKRVVLDTNVLVSALLRAAGVPGRILDTILLGELTPVFDDRIFVEVALAAQAPLVTGNQKHFPAAVIGSFELQVFTPADFLKTLELNR